MYQRKQISQLASYLFILSHIITAPLHAGFSPETRISTQEALKPMREVQRGDIVLSRSHNNHVACIPVIHVTSYVTNHLYLIITDTQTLYADASQQLFVYNRDCWEAASNLYVGDTLRHSDDTCAHIHDIKILTGTYRVYTVTLNHNHTLYVTPEHILAHNECITSSTLAMSSLSETSLVLAHPAVAGGVAIGVVGYGLYAFFNDRKSKNKDNNDTQERKPQTAAGGAGDPDGPRRPHNTHGSHDPCPEKRDNGAQAPGRPLEEDGFTPPKNWDGKKVKHSKTGQYGWPDAKGNIWVPTGPGPLAHRGPHWDVITPQGAHINILPGGKAVS